MKVESGSLAATGFKNSYRFAASISMIGRGPKGRIMLDHVIRHMPSSFVFLQSCSSSHTVNLRHEVLRC